MNAPHTTDVEFSQLGLDDRLLKSLNEHDLTHCTPVQAECLPIALAGKDVAGQAQTGTGKTAAFLLAIMQHLLNKPERSGRKQQQPRAIIISPTRELAIQIHKDAVMLNAHAGLSLGLVYGGVDYEKQRNSLNEKIDILIGTPGRLIDYHKQNVYSLKGIEIVVLDEADRMFDLGFISDIRYMFRRMPTPENRLNMLFSATLSHRVAELAYEHMNSPEKVIINPDQVTAENVKQTMYHVANDEKIPLLLGLMRRIDPKRTIVFVNTKRVAEKVWSYLEGNGFHAAILSGDVPQKKRQRLFAEFSEGKLPVLVATDLAARGLHVPDVSHIFNYDLPQNAEDYVHRIGRTARAGASG
ncbi:MAG: DEAD/DEAH box helicase, partial [Gammaproteobacteria bacterium]